MLQSGGIYSYAQAHLAFFTNDGSGGWSAPSERMRIKDNGNVGIGTTDPGTKLDVAGVTRSGAFLTNDATTTSIPIDTGGSKAYFDASNINGPAITLRADSVGRTIRMYDGNSSVAAIDTNSGGLYIATNSSHPILFAPNASEAMRIAVGGNVAIGTTNSGYGKLGVYDASNSLIGIANSTSYAQFQQNGADLYINVNLSGTAGAGSLVFRRGASSTESMRIDPSGNVGIGTTSPATKLHVDGDIFSTSSFGLNAVPSIGARFRTYSMSDPNWGLSTYAADPEYHTIIHGYGSGGSNRQFRVYDHNAGATRFCVNFDNGNTGIGTTSPVTKLQVASDTNAVDVLRVGNTAGDSGSVQGVTHLAINHFNAGTNPSTRITAYQDGVSGWPGGMYFSTRSLNTDSAPVERMRITSAGNVGIGTTAPSHLLHVAGDVRIDAADNAPQVNYFDSSLNYVYGESGAQEIILGKPDIWLRINVDGTDYVFPGYNVTA